MSELVYAVAFARAWEVYRTAVRHEERRNESGDLVGYTPVPLTAREIHAACDRDASECRACWEAGQ